MATIGNLQQTGGHGPDFLEAPWFPLTKFSSASLELLPPSGLSREWIRFRLGTNERTGAQGTRVIFRFLLADS